MRLTVRAIKVFAGLRAFGAPLDSLNVAENDLASYDGVVQLGSPPNRIDILMNISGVTFEETLNGSAEFELDGRTVAVIGLDALLKNKRAAARVQDLLDVEALETKSTMIIAAGPANAVLYRRRRIR